MTNISIQTPLTQSSDAPIKSFNKTPLVWLVLLLALSVAPSLGAYPVLVMKVLCLALFA